MKYSAVLFVRLTAAVAICLALFLLLAACGKETPPKQVACEQCSPSESVFKPSSEPDAKPVDLAAVVGDYTKEQAADDGLVIYATGADGNWAMSDDGERWMQFTANIEAETPSVIQFALVIGSRVELWELEYDGQKVSRRLYSVDGYVNERFVYEVQYMLSSEKDADLVSGYGGDADLAKKDGCISCVLIRKHSPFAGPFTALHRCFFLRYTK